MQGLVSELGKMISAHRGGDCMRVLAYHETWINFPLYSNPPASLEGAHAEYRAAIDDAVVAVDPVYKICYGGGGTIDVVTLKQLLDRVDADQNRLNQVRKQVEGLP